MTRLAHAALAAVLLFTSPLSTTSAAAAPPIGAPMRILVLADSSGSVASQLNHFRAGLNALIDAVPEDAELTLISTGGQIRIRVPVTTDRAKLHDGAAMFASDGGANSMLETMMEADTRFLKPAADKWPIIVMLTTDNAETRGEPRIDAYNKFMNDFLRRGGIAHAIVLKGNSTGVVTDIALNLTGNTGGIYQALAVGNSLPDVMKKVGDRLKLDAATPQMRR
jgi:hypothetical protein